LDGRHQRLVVSSLVRRSLFAEKPFQSEIEEPYLDVPIFICQLEKWLLLQRMDHSNQMKHDTIALELINELEAWCQLQRRTRIWEFYWKCFDPTDPRMLPAYEEYYDGPSKYEAIRVLNEIQKDLFEHSRNKPLADLREHFKKIAEKEILDALNSGEIRRIICLPQFGKKRAQKALEGIPYSSVNMHSSIIFHRLRISVVLDFPRD
jgi:hypothetical protein